MNGGRQLRPMFINCCQHIMLIGPYTSLRYPMRDIKVKIWILNWEIL